MKNKLKLFSVLVLLIVGTIGLASAAEMEGPVAYDDSHDISIGVEVNDVLLSQSDRKNIEKADELDIMVTLKIDNEVIDGVAVEDLEGVVVEATITSDGSNKDRITDVTREFTAKDGDIYDKRLTLSIPVRMEQDLYSLKIRVEDNMNSKTFFYPLRVDAKDHLLEVKDIILSPENSIESGRTLLVSARVKNRGQASEEDVKVKVSIPELGLSATDYVDQIDEEDCTDDDCDDSITSGTVYLKIPQCAEPGDYQLKVDISYDDGDESTSLTEVIRIVASEEDVCGEAPAQKEEVTKTIITIGPESQEANKGSAVMYPITLTNAGTSARTYTIEVDTADWAALEVTPSNVVVLGAGESKSVYVKVTAKATAAAGENMFSVTVKSGDKVLKQVPLKAVVKEVAQETSTTWSKLKKALEIGLVVLVVLLVILGLIIGFNKLKGDEEEDKEEGQTYY